MNTLNVTTIESPRGYMEECAHFVIDDVTMPFALNDIMSIGEEYTFSAWIKSDGENEIQVFNNSYPVNLEWEKCVFNSKAEEKDLKIYFLNPGTYYIYRSQLEIGNIESDWRPSPLDFDEKLDESYEELFEEITNKDTTILQTVDEILLSALKSYVETTTFTEFKTTTETRLSVFSDQVNIKISETIDELERTETSLQEKYNVITKYFTFEKDGFVIGKIDNPYKVIIDNDRYSMLANDVEVMWISNGEVHAKVITIENTFKNQGYIEEMDELGRLNCRWVGGD